MNAGAKIPDQTWLLEFDRGKLHDFVFVGTPELTKGGDLTRNSISLTTADTFLYGASLLDLSRQFALSDPSIGSSFLDTFGDLGLGQTLEEAQVQNRPLARRQALDTARQGESLLGRVRAPLVVAIFQTSSGVIGRPR